MMPQPFVPSPQNEQLLERRHTDWSAASAGAGNPRWPKWGQWGETLAATKKNQDGAATLSLKGFPKTETSLSDGSVFLFGLGAIGGVAFQQLARCGLRMIQAVDPDRYGPESYLTQPSQWRHAGQPKARVQGAVAHRINPASILRTAICEAQDVPIRRLRQADVLLVAGDNFQLPLWAGRMAAALGKPLVQAAVHGESGLAIIRAFDLRSPENACPQCGVSQKELADQTSRHGCDPGSTRSDVAEPTRTLPTVCSVAGQMLTNEALKWVLRLDNLALRGEELVQSLLTYRSWRTTLPRRRTCTAPHQMWNLVDISTPASQTTLAMLAAHLAAAIDAALLQVRSELPWISFTICPGCEQRVAVRKFAQVRQQVGHCECGQALLPIPQGMHSVIPADDLRACWELPLSRLGLAQGEAVGMMLDDTWTYFLTNEEPTKASMSLFSKGK